MRAFVLAGGLGTRLRPKFGDLPKALAPVAGKPVLVRQLEWLAQYGIDDVVLCLGHGADRVRSALGDGRGLAIRIEYSIEDEPLGTGGALRLAARFVEGPALVANGDTLLPCDPWDLERDRWENAALGSIALYEVADASDRGRVERDSRGWVHRFVEKDPGHRGRAWVNGGLYACAPELWRRMPGSGPFSIERDLFASLAGAGRLRGFALTGEFHDIGTPEAWEHAERSFRT